MNKEEVIEIFKANPGSFKRVRLEEALTRAIELLQEPAGIKEQIVEKMKELGGDTRSTWYKSWDNLKQFILSLPDSQPDEPTHLPFQSPIPNGFEVVTRDGREVGQLVSYSGNGFAGIINGFDGVYTWREDGRDFGQDIREFDLFLRRKEKKVWVVEHSSGMLSAMPYEERERVDKWLEGTPKAKLYEATLKPVV